MKTANQVHGFTQTLVTLAVLAAFAPARAQDIGELTTPANGGTISIGVGVASGDEKDRSRFGMFNGLRTQKGHGLLGFSYLDRDDATGKWFTLEGRNLGLDNREIGFSYRKLGDMKLWGEYSELVRHDPRTINTGLIGPGSTTPTVQLLTAPGTGSEVNLELKRKSISLNAEKWFNGNLQMEVNFKNEDKDGARLFGKGFACASGAAPGCAGPTAAATGWALLLLPEPVNFTIRQIDMKLNWSGEKLKLSGGYYGSFFTNANGNITPSVPGTLVNGLGTALPLSAGLQSILNLPIALQPDNQAQQFFVGGNYRFSPKTLVNFKYSYTHATQNEDFLAMGLTGAPGGRTNLGGVVDTTRAQAGFSSHPWNKVHLHGDLKYESRNDKTPIATYNIEGVNTFSNGNFSPKKLDGKLEASYRLPANYSATGTVFFETEDLGTFTPTNSVAGLSGIKQKHEERGSRIELRKSMSETLTGWVSYQESRRHGDSPWLKPRTLPLTGVFPADPNCASSGANACIFSPTGIFPFIFEDRERKKWKFVANWQPTERLSITGFAENGIDTYHGPTFHGLRNAGMNMYSADAAYTLTDAWKLTGYVSQGHQTTKAGHSTGYDAELEDIATSAGFGIIGKPSGRFQVGADLTYLYDRLKYNQFQGGVSPTNELFLREQGGLPDVVYRLLRLKLFGEYAVDKNSYLRLDLIHYRSFFNEWTYNFGAVPFFFSDNTTLNAVQDQRTTFVGASYVYRFK